MSREIDALAQAAEQMIRDSDCLDRFVDRAIEVMEWEFQGDKAAQRKEALRCIRQMWNQRRYRHFSTRLLWAAVDVCEGLDYLTPLIQRRALRAEERVRAEADELHRPGMATARRERARKTG